MTGWVVRLDGDVVSWASKKQHLVAQSTCEAELYAEAAAVQEVLWLRGLLGELSLTLASPSMVFGDNQSTVTVSEQGVRSERTKHVDVKYHFITEHIERGDIKVRWVPTERQLADVLTKPLAGQAFERFRRELMLH